MSRRSGGVCLIERGRRGLETVANSVETNVESKEERDI